MNGCIEIVMSQCDVVPVSLYSVQQGLASVTYTYQSNIVLYGTNVKCQGYLDQISH